MSNTNIYICLFVLCTAQLIGITNAFGQTDEHLINKKADFIITASSKVTLPQVDGESVFKIGVYGKEKEANLLFKELVARSTELFIQNKEVEVLLFRKTKHIVPVNIFYVNGESKIRISDIDDRIEDYPYIILTENFPFGTSMLNFAVNKNDNVLFELQPEVIWGKGGKIDNKFLNAANRVHSEENWAKLLLVTSKQLENEILKSQRQKKIIEEQTDEIIIKSERIDYQQVVIVITIVFLLVLMMLAYFLFVVNKKRKLANNQLAQKNKEITDSIQYARLIQDALLPKQEEVSNSFSDSFVLNMAKDIVSGDFYWHNEFDNISVLAVIDSAGHGVPGAFMSVMGNELFRFTLNNKNVAKPGLVLQQIDDNIKESFNDNLSRRAEGMDIVLIAYNKTKKELYYSGANRPLLLIRNGELKVFEPTRKSIGGLITQKNRFFETNTIPTKTGDSFYLFTDGFQDQFGGEAGKKFSRKRLHALLLNTSSLKMSEQELAIRNAFINWQSEEDQVDDICMVGIKI